MSTPFGNYIDLFNGTALADRWFVNTGPVTVSGGKLVNTVDFDINAGAGPPSPTVTNGPFTGKFVIQQFKTSPNYGSWLYVNVQPFADETAIGFDVFDGNIELYFEGAAVYTVAYDQALHKALRIREDDGTLYAEIWNGSVWNVVFSTATPAWVAEPTIADSHGGYVNGTPGPSENVTLYSYNILESEITPTMGYVYSNLPRNLGDPGYNLLGIRRSVGVNAVDGWEDSISPVDLGWGIFTSWSLPVIHGANGRWIAIADDFQRNSLPNVIINYSPTLDPAAWGTPFYLISAGFVADIYDGTGSSLNAGFRRLNFGNAGLCNPDGFAANASKGAGNARAQLKFLRNPDHPAGGRWWLMARDTLLFSDTNGETWDQSLANHLGLEADMHPFLNWRRNYPDAVNGNKAGGLRYSYPNVLDMANDPLNPDRVMCVGVCHLASANTNLPGISNRLAVFCTSDDFGDTWSAVGQLPIGLSRISGYDAVTAPNAGNDHVATAANIFPRIA